jgi:predicted aconitase with swiveling domain
LPAAVVVPETVVPSAELEISTIPREVIGAPLVIVEELESLTVAALIAPVPVLTVCEALEMITSCDAVKVASVFEKAFDAPVE